MSLWSRLIHGCIPSHSYVRTRNDKTEAILKCSDCGEEIAMLQGEMLTNGPQREPATVLGQPITKVIRERPAKVVGGRFT